MEQTMEYTVFKLSFPAGVHLGKTSLEDAEYTFHADTLFSALYQEAVKEKEREYARQLLEYAHEGSICFSDAFPYKGEEYFIPKPFIHIRNKDKQGDSKLKKAFKNMKYLPACLLDQYLEGKFGLTETEHLSDLGEHYQKTSAFVRNNGETQPYRVGSYYFHEGNGLYVIVGYKTKECFMLIRELFHSLSFSGIGGKRTSGMGRFHWKEEEIPMELSDKLKMGNKEKIEKAGYILLSVALPREEELSQALFGASYSLLRRGGFVASADYADEYMRKKDLYVFSPGSYFTTPFMGAVYDVSSGGRHPVYRYAKPMFMEVSGI